MAKPTERQKKIMNMPLIVFDSYLANLDIDQYNDYLRFCETAVKDNSNHAVTSKNRILNLISCNADKDDFTLKLMDLAHTFNSPKYFSELVEAGISREEIAHTYHTTVENVACQILLNEKGKQLTSATVNKQYRK